MDRMTVDSVPASTLSLTPQAGQIIQHNGKEFETVKEGLAYILIPRSSTSLPGQQGKKKPTEEKDRPAVFYNPIQQFNRDLSVLAIRAFGAHSIAVKRERHGKKLKRERERKRGETSHGKKRKREAEAEEIDDDDCEPPNKIQCTGENEDVPTDAMLDVTGADAVTNDKKPWTPRFTILDALSATGLRALRYAKEIPFVTQVIANDLSASAIASMRMNIEHNKLGNTVRPHIGDACAYMYSTLDSRKSGANGSFSTKFDVVDLDPYGTAAPFIDAALQSVSDGGMLCVTCTDAGVFASTGYPEKAFALYGGTSMKGVHSHEGGLRLILQALSTNAAKYGIAIEPLLSLSIDFYARVFVRVHRSPAKTKFAASKSMMVYNCDSGCGAWTTQRLSNSKKMHGKNGKEYYVYGLSQAPTATPNCEHCGFKTHLAGPMWAGPLHNSHFIQRVLNLLADADPETYPTFGRIEGMLITALEEDLHLAGVPEDPHAETVAASEQQSSTQTPSLLIPELDPEAIEPHPFFFMTSAVSKVLHTKTMPENALRGALRKLGYRSTRSHAKPGSIRTDAPWSVVWEIMREWVRQKAPIKEGALTERSPGAGIMRRDRYTLNVEGEGANLGALKRDVLSAVESGKDISDLVTKIEAALYRSGIRQSLDKQKSKINKPADKTLENGHATTPDPSTLDIVFDEELGRTAIDAQRKKRLIRYQINPRRNWGPLARAPVTAEKRK